MLLLLLGFYVGLLMLYAFALWATRACRTLEPLNALIKLGRSKRLAHALDRTICAYLAVLYLMYPMLVTRSVSLFDCRQITAAQPLPDGTVAPNGITRELYVQKFLPRMAARWAATAPPGASMEWHEY